MKTTIACFGLFALSALNLPGQNRIPFVRAVGQASVSVKPDQAKVSLSVVTQASSADQASTQNATQVTNVINQLTTLLGPNADIKTISYSLNPNYTYSQGQQPVLNGYTATNTIQVTSNNLAIIGRIIDTGIQAGANQVQSLQFDLQNDQDAKAQALKQATAQAKVHADAMAAGVGLHTGVVQVIQEGVASTITPLVFGAAAGASSPTTPIQSGNLTVQATVTLDISLQ